MYHPYLPCDALGKGGVAHVCCTAFVLAHAPPWARMCYFVHDSMLHGFRVLFASIVTETNFAKKHKQKAEPSLTSPDACRFEAEASRPVAV